MKTEGGMAWSSDTYNRGADGLSTPFGPAIQSNGLPRSAPGTTSGESWRECGGKNSHSLFRVTACRSLQDRQGRTENSVCCRSAREESAFLCKVCNLQLKSPEQVQVHYDGKAHRRRLRSLGIEPAESTLTTGHILGGCPCPGSHATLIPATPPHTMDMQSFLPISLNPTASLFPNFSSMDPVQKAVINHTFGVSSVPKRRQLITCNICRLRFNSQSQAEAHYKGSRHAKKLKALEGLKTKEGTETTITSITTTTTAQHEATSNAFGASTLSTPPDDPRQSSEISEPSSATQAIRNCEPDGSDIYPPGTSPIHSDKLVCKSRFITEKPEGGRLSVEASSGGNASPSEPEVGEYRTKKLLYCSLCKLAVNSFSQLEAHNNGARHKAVLEGKDIKIYLRNNGRRFVYHKTPYPADGQSSLTLSARRLHCEHISIQRYKDKVTGKTSKTKYKPYRFQQKGPSSTARVQLPSELCNSLRLSMLQSPLVAATASAASQNVDEHHMAILSHLDLGVSWVTSLGFEAALFFGLLNLATRKRPQRFFNDKVYFHFPHSYY
uniref:C2H2-type domain-containing protein n=1 Tax=Eptatretus burgeri TaxID=7764 RepID=A0A8C4R9S2_EPTBU